MLFLLAACSQKAQLQRLGPDATVLAFGDSLTYGTGAAPGQSYPAQLARLTGLKVINAGVPGEVTGQGLARLPGVLEQTRPQLMILIEGGNDFLRHQDEQQTQANLEQMIKLARKRGVQIVMLGVPRPRVFLSSAPLYEHIADATGTVLDDDTLPDILGDAKLKSDPVHPNAAGYLRLAEAVRTLLADHGALPESH